MSGVKTFYFRAYDEAGRKRSGTIPAVDRRAADAELRKINLRPYFLDDYRIVRRALHHRHRRRQKTILGLGTAAVGLSLVFGAGVVAYMSRERPITVEEYTKTGVITGVTAAIVTETEEDRQFALELYRTWDTFVPNAVTGLELKGLLLTIYVSGKIRDLSEKDLELLATNSIRAYQRRTGTSSCTLLVIEGDTTLFEVNYDAFTRFTRVKSYW